ncbi:MAG: shikimate dehydrogenase [Methanomassiliicoccales archaeon]|nr:shikimate dehydrogenase [Methanomassiliicoccales archaeon]
MTKICVSIKEPSAEGAAQAAQSAVEGGADLVEVRFDLMPSLPHDLSAFKKVEIPKIATLRTRSQGGGFDGKDATMLDLYQRALRAGFEMLDLELGSPILERRDKELRRAGAICSHHDFEGTPTVSAILDILIRASAKEALPKGAFTINSCKDLLAIAEAARMFSATEKEFVLIGMGELGMLTRVCADRLGCAFTYVSSQVGNETAQGQLDLTTMRRLAKERTVVGIVGDPVAHSLSPAIHNAAFLEVGVPGIYLKFPVRQGDLEDFMEVAVEYGMRGFNVTIPHKEVVGRLLDRLAPSAVQVGAVNTVLVEEGELVGHNTDVHGVEMTFKEKGIDPKGKSALLVGAGGAARACCAYLSAAGAKVKVYNRTKARAEELCRAFRNCQAIGPESLSTDFDIVINGTPLGMTGFPDGLPIPDNVLRPGQFVVDLIYTPPRTPFLEAAERAGASTANGEIMLVHQAIGSFELWTGRTPSFSTMSSALQGGSQ